MMAATGANRRERRLAQPPRGFHKAAPADRGGLGRRGLHFPNWVAAVLVCAALISGFLALLSPHQRSAFAQTSTDGAPVVVPILFPLEQRVAWTDTFGAARDGGRTHAGNDLMAPKMTPILAVVDGTVDWLNLTGKVSSYNGLPYYNLLLRGDDGNDYFYIHLNNDTPGTDDGQGGPQYAYAPGLTNGSRVTTGQVIGYVGDSGNAEDCPPHLHFEIHLGGYVAAGPGQTRPPSAINPYYSLKAAPTLAEWEAAGRPPLATLVAANLPTTTLVTDTSTTRSTTTTAPPPVSPVTTTASTGSVFVPGFIDVKTTDWFYADFAYARAAGVVTPDPDGRFRPYSLVSRALYAVYLVRAVAPSTLQVLSSSGGALAEGRFADVEPRYWAFSEIEIAANLGLVKGTGDGSTFSPELLVTRAQMATMMYRALKDLPAVSAALANKQALPRFKDIPSDYWAAEAIGAMQVLGLMRGDAQGRFRPLEDTTRAQAVTIMARLLRLMGGAPIQQPLQPTQQPPEVGN